MITEAKTKRDIVAQSRITKSYPVRFEKIMESDPRLDPVLTYRATHGSIDISVFDAADRKYISEFSNQNHVINFLRQRFFCDIEKAFCDCRKIIYFIELKKYFYVDLLETTALIDAEPFCEKIKIFNYLKQYWEGIELVGHFGIIKITMPRSVLQDSLHAAINIS